MRRRGKCHNYAHFLEGNICISVNSKPHPSKSKSKEVRATKLYGMCYPWLSCSKFNSIVQKAAVQNYESI